MPTTRSSQGSQSSPKSATKTGSKRAADSTASPKAKRGKTEKDQKTIEETMNGIESVEDDKDIANQIDNKKTEESNGHTEKANIAKQADNKKSEESNGQKEKASAVKQDGLKAREEAVKKREDAMAEKENAEPNDSKRSEENTEHDGGKSNEKNAFDEVKADAGEVTEAAKEEEAEKSEQIISNNDSVIEDDKREAAMPSSILEKGIIYFFFRGRVGVEDPQGLDDIARSYIVLRPLPIGAKLGEGPLEDSGNARLLALPKKMLPKSHSDRFLMFVEKANTSVKDLKENFIAGSQYSTQTRGTSNVPAATPIAEGVYAITSTGRESHLAYHVTVPEIGEVQQEIGLQEKGSYVLSAKNPTASAPANASLDKSPDYPESVMKRFRNLRWMPLEPDLLDYENTQFLIIGEGLGDLDKAMEEQAKDKKDDAKAAPIDEMEQLENEDAARVEHLKGNDPIFEDLGLSSKQYPKMQSTW